MPSYTAPYGEFPIGKVFESLGPQIPGVIKYKNRELFAIITDAGEFLYAECRQGAGYLTLRANPKQKQDGDLIWHRIAPGTITPDDDRVEYGLCPAGSFHAPAPNMVAPLPNAKTAKQARDICDNAMERTRQRLALVVRNYPNGDWVSFQKREGVDCDGEWV